VNESIQMTGSATGGVTPYTYTWDFNNDGVYNDGVGVNPTYTWRASGTYTIHLKVNDTAGKNDTDSAQVTVNIRNSPPNKPSTLEGPASGKTKKVLTYSSGAVDPNGDQIYLLFDWGDGNTSGWLGPFNSGTAHAANHTWTVKGSYNIKVKAKDTHNEESAWSDPLTISITRRISAEYTTPIIENLKNRFPALENLITALLNIIETMRLNHSSLIT
jgi:PKD repeat protein